MSTPESKYQLGLTKSASKYLTPCRTLGLKRKSSSPRTPCSKIVCRDEIKDSPALSVDHGSKLPLKNIQNKITDNSCSQNEKLAQKENFSPKITDKATVSDNFISKSTESSLRVIDKSISKSNETLLRVKDKSISKSNETPLRVKDKSISKSNETPLRVKDKSISSEKLLDTINNINNKIEKINNLKRNEVYTRRHNIIELRESTEKWKKACKDVILTIYETIKSTGHDVSIKNILDEHNIPYEQIGFNEDTMDFD